MIWICLRQHGAPQIRLLWQSLNRFRIICVASTHRTLEAYVCINVIHIYIYAYIQRYTNYYEYITSFKVTIWNALLFRFVVTSSSVKLNVMGKESHVINPKNPVLEVVQALSTTKSITSRYLDKPTCPTGMESDNAWRSRVDVSPPASDIG